ncbi:MAG: EpsG family protein [Gammaproteobacteria bacterium]|nr:EpsG family protein [Gammaproteobacteria bacterium]
MWPYWMLFIVPAYLAISRLTLTPYSTLNLINSKWPFAWRFIFVVLVLMIGFRHEVGGDWAAYILNMENLEEFSKYADPSSQILFWFGRKTGGGIYLVNLISAAFFSWGLVTFCRNQPRAWLALTVAVPYLVTVVAMGYTRQGVAIGLAMMAIVAFGRGNTLKFVFLVALAATFHKSAVILAPLAVLASTKHRIFTLLWVGIATLLLFFLLLQEALDNLISGYIQDEYESSGAAIRVVMNAVPAVLFLLFRNRFQLTKEQRSFWTWMALSAILLIAALYFSPSSTAVDRVALYWIPLQLFVLSSLPNVLGSRSGKNAFLVYVIVLYSVAVLLVWLFFGAHSVYWLPYQFYPWVWLWQ